MIIVGSLLPLPAFPQMEEPLSPAEIQAAREAVKLFSGNEPAPEELLRSGKVKLAEWSGFAEFATPFTDISDRLKFGSTIFCTFPPPEWRCERGSYNRARIGKNPQVISVGELDARTVADIVDYLHSQCYVAQSTALKKPSSDPSYFPPPIGGLDTHARGFVVHLYEGLAGRSYSRSYIFEKVDAKADGCAFKLDRAYLDGAHFLPPREPDAFPWMRAGLLLLVPALLAGIIGALVALTSAKTTLVTKRAFQITWVLGIVLALLGGIVNNAVHPGLEYSGFLPFMYAMIEVPISLAMGGLVAAACGIVINLRNSGTTGDSVPSPAKIVTPKRHAAPVYPKDSMAEQLRQTYASMDDEELVELSARGTLTETAQKVIDEELRARSAKAP